MNTATQKRSVISKIEPFIVVLALGFILLFIVVSIIRLNYPYELEWIEGGYVDEVKWIMDGHFPYGTPSIQFIPSSKTPLYFYISAALMKIIGVGFVAPRLVSILTTLGSFLMIFLIVSSETNKPSIGIISAGLYAACFRFAGAWMDIAKTDSLFIFLVLLAFYIGRQYQEVWKMVLSGVIFTLAYFTKQITLPIILSFAVISTLVTKGRALYQWATTFLLGFAIFAFLEIKSNRWFSFYTFQTVVKHEYFPDLFLFWKKFLPIMWPASLLILFYFLYIVIKTKPTNWIILKGFWINFGFFIALILASWSVFLKVWTYDNGLMPACVGISILAGLSYYEITKIDLHERYIIETRRFSLSQQSLLLAAGLSLLSIQFALLVYNPIEQIPTKQDRKTGDEFISTINELDGEVLLWDHGFLNYIAKKNTFMHHSFTHEAVAGEVDDQNSAYYRRREELIQAFYDATSEQLFNWVIIDKPDVNWPPYYVYIGEIFSEPEFFYPVTGTKKRPESLLVKNPIAKGGSLPINDPLFNSLFIEGWSESQDWGRWSNQIRSIVLVGLEKKHKYQIEFEAQPNCIDNQPYVTSISVSINGSLIGEENISSCSKEKWIFNIHKDLLSNDLNSLGFDFQLQSDQVINEDDILEGTPLMAFTKINFVQLNK